eukprot:5486312-Prymnesium_polylepis.1
MRKSESHDSALFFFGTRLPAKWRNCWRAPSFGYSMQPSRSTATNCFNSTSTSTCSFHGP